jgi:glycosyltransferase involved in cell wall biosynthesis
MKKAIAVYYYTISQNNAIGRCNRIILEQLCEKYDFTVFSSRFDNPRPDRINWVRIAAPMTPMLACYAIFRVWALVEFTFQKHIRGRRFDLVQASDGCVDFADLDYVHFCHKAYIQRFLHFADMRSLRGISRALNGFLHRVWEGALYRRSPQLVVPSQGLRRELGEYCHVGDSAMTVLSNPVDLDYYLSSTEERTSAKQNLGVDTAEVVLVFVALGHFERKGLGPLIDSLANPLLKGVKLLVVGGSVDSTAAYRKRAKRQKVDQQVVFCGPQTDIRKFLRAADAFVLPSRYEVFPLVALEAAASGLPLITSQLNGVEEFALSGTTGFVLQEIDAGAIGDAIDRLRTTSPEERQRMGRNARSAVEKYGIRQFAAAWDQVLSTRLADLPERSVGNTGATPELDNNKTQRYISTRQPRFAAKTTSLRPPPPDFVIAGAPKCGTTSVYTTFSSHPRVFLPSMKEPHYFAFDYPRRRQIETLNGYDRLFANAQDGQLRGDASVYYLSSKTAIPSILERRPDAKFIVLVRNPLEMFVSWHNEMLKSLDEDENEPEAAWRRQEDRARGAAIPRLCIEPAMLQYNTVCSLGAQVKRMYQIVGERQRLILLYDDLVDNPQLVSQRIAEFLGIQDAGIRTFVHDNAFGHYRGIATARLVRSMLANSSVKRFRAMMQPVLSERDIHPMKWLVRKNLKAAAKPQMTEQFREELLCAFESDTMLLEQLLDRDLSSWRRRGASPMAAGQVEYMSGNPCNTQ